MEEVVGCPLATVGRLALLPPCDGVAAPPGPKVAGDGEADRVGPGLGEAELLWVADDWADATGLVNSGTARDEGKKRVYLGFRDNNFVYENVMCSHMVRDHEDWRTLSYAGVMHSFHLFCPTGDRYESSSHICHLLAILKYGFMRQSRQNNRNLIQNENYKYPIRNCIGNSLKH